MRDDIINEQGTPDAVVRVFIIAMHDWEVATWRSMRSVRDSDNPESYLEQAQQRLDEVFSRYCTARDRKYGRNGSYQNPPEYDLEKEAVTAIDVDGSRAFVDTYRDGILDGGEYRYTLHEASGRWFIDNLKYRFSAKWEAHIL